MADPMIELGARMREQQAYDEMNAAWDKDDRASGARELISPLDASQGPDLGELSRQIQWLRRETVRRCGYDAL